MTEVLEGQEAFEEVVEGYATTDGTHLADICRNGRTLLVFLRHSGCTFCRELLANLETARASGRIGDPVVLVAMTDSESLHRLLRRYHCDDLPLVADPEGRLYRAAGLSRGTLSRLFGLPELFRGVLSIWRHGTGRLDGDGFQLSGAVLLDNLRIVRRYASTRASDQPDLCDLAR